MKTFYTKCGIEFKKSSEAMVTGYTDPDNPKCESCPFRIDIKEGWPPVHKKFECRAGSEPPNHKNEWRGSLEDKNTIHVWSLDHEFMESIIAFCIDHPDLGAGYNQDLSDCRRQVSISCSPNRKGMAAKKELVDKFFGEKPIICTNCENEDSGCAPNNPQTGLCIAYDRKPEPKRYVDTKTGRLIFVRAGIGFDEFKAQYQDAGKWGSGSGAHSVKSQSLPWRKTPEEAQADLDAYAEKKNWKIYTPENKDKEDKDLNCNITNCGFNNEAGGCGFEAKDINNKVFTEYAEEAIKLGCQNEVMREAFHNQPCLSTSPKKPRNLIDEVCEEMREDCPCFCEHNDGCAARLMRGDALKDYIENTTKEHGVLNCDIYKKIYEKYFPSKEIPEEVEMEIVKPEDKDLEETNLQRFDYSQLDTDTAAYLQEKEAKITQIRMMSAYAIGKELKEAQDKFANHNQGTFGKWSESLGLGKSTVYNYINAYNYVVQNLDDPNQIENIQPSLLFAISKPSAPAELQKAVIDGDITTHKQYKELEAKLKAREAEKEAEEKKARENYLAAQRYKIQAEQAEEALEKLNIAQVASPSEVTKLQKQLEEAKNQVEMLTDELMKPVDIEPAVIEKEVERAADKDFDYVSDIIGKLLTVHSGQIKNWAKVLGENSKFDLESTRQNLIASNRQIANMMDAIEDEIAKK